MGFGSVSEMIIMPANNTGKVVMELYHKHPGKLAFLQTPQVVKPKVLDLTYAIDNGAFSRFREKDFFALLELTKQHNDPMFVVCPDVVGCHDRTLALWHHYLPMLRGYQYPLAFVAQDGCTPDAVPDEADWIFVGGNDPWKMMNVHHFIGDRSVHVGRVNSLKRLKICEELGVASVDGTGWMRARDQKYYDFLGWFEESKQLEMFSKG